MGSTESIASGPPFKSSFSLMPRLTIHPRCDLDVLEIFDYLAARSPQAAARFLNAVTDARRRIASNPQFGATFPRIGHEYEEWRFLRLMGFENYLVLYRCTPPETIVARVVHGSRDLEAALRHT